jgi:hypothetical protein
VYITNLKSTNGTAVNLDYGTFTPTIQVIPAAGTFTVSSSSCSYQITSATITYVFKFTFTPPPVPNLPTGKQFYIGNVPFISDAMQEIWQPFTMGITGLGRFNYKMVRTTAEPSYFSVTEDNNSPYVFSLDSDERDHTVNATFTLKRG